MFKYIFASAFISIALPVAAHYYSDDAKKIHEVIISCGAPTMLGVPHLIDDILDVHAQGIKKDYSLELDKAKIRNSIANIMYNMVKDNPDDTACKFYRGTSENEAMELLVVISYHAKIAEHQLRENLGLED